VYLIRHRVSLLAIVVGSAFLFASAARAQDPPTPGNSTCPAFIRLVGSTAGVPDTAAGKFLIVIRDIANNPVPNSFVVLDLSGCPDVRIASDQLNPNYTVNCTNHTVGAYTNASGQVAFTLLGSSWNAGTHSGLSCGRAYFDGVQLAAPTVATFDLNGLGGVEGSDAAVFLTDIASHVYRGRDDFDGGGTVTGADLAMWMTRFATHRSQTSSATCP
jgi:hypothetical protein